MISLYIRASTQGGNYDIIQTKKLHQLPYSGPCVHPNLEEDRLSLLSLPLRRICMTGMDSTVIGRVNPPLKVNPFKV